MDESARKRKRDEDDGASDDDESGSDADADLGSEVPKEGIKRGDATKKAKPDQESEKSQNGAKSAEKVEARKKQREEKKDKKKTAQKEKKKAKDTTRKGKQQQDEQKKPAQQNEAKSNNTKTNEEPPSNDDDEDGSDDDDNDDENEQEGISLEFQPERTEQPSTASSTPNSPSFDVSNPQSGSSSISSIVPPTANESKQESSDQKPLKPTPEELKQRLQKRLDELRAARHADGLNGKPARNRQELIEARRQKAEQRKTHKKMLRQKAKEEEQRKNDEAMARRFSPGSSGSLLASPRSPAESTNNNNTNDDDDNASYSFGRMVFTDGQQTDPTLNNVRDKPKKQGSQDPATALRAAESKKARLSSMDETKRTDIEQKDLWLNAKKRAHGERVRDDTSLLKKALKRKESAKRKSEREWKERLDAVKKGQDMRQSKRDENLRKRRDEKGANKGKKDTKTKKKARPGFEGSFKAKVGGKKK